MSELSPAAKAVFHAFNSKFDWVEDGVPGPQFNSIAAALRAAVAQTQRHPGHDIWQCDADDLLAIAAELEAQ
jgi:hypothetical protein